MQLTATPRSLWAILILVSGLPRILGALFLPNGFGDAYVYIRDIGTMSTKISNGTFRLTDIFGFWLPLYQFIAALVNILVKNGFYSGKLVSAGFGIAACLFVYLITLSMTGNRLAALAAFFLIALNPLHIFYSASAMTDVPHAWFVLGSLYFVLKQRWTVAAMFAALAGLTRVESWMFLAIIPVLQFLRERRLSMVPVVLLLVPPVFWFYISWKATGDWLSCFKQRQFYLRWLLAANPSLATFSLPHVLKDGATLLISSDIAVLIAAFVACWFVVKQLPLMLRHRTDDELFAILPAVVFFLAFFSLLTVAYLTHQQPIIFPRYGLILFTLGLPILMWTFLMLKRRNPRWSRRLLMIVAAICVIDGGIELAGAVGSLNAIAVQRKAADYLRDNFDPRSSEMIFSDEGTVTVMSGIAENRFLTSSDAPRESEAFLRFLRDRNVGYLVFVNQEDSTPAKLFPQLDGAVNSRFDLVLSERTRFQRTEIWVYRVRR
jgi:hypothetical protein